VEIEEPKTEISMGYPEELTEDNVQYWDKHTKQLAKSQVSKALKFVKYDCVKYVGDDPEFNHKYTFIVLPLNTESKVVVNGKVFYKKPYPKDYNYNVYKIYKREDGLWECNCQGWQTKFKKGDVRADGVMCSHTLALMFAFKLKKFGKNKRRDKNGEE